MLGRLVDPREDVACLLYENCRGWSQVGTARMALEQDRTNGPLEVAQCDRHRRILATRQPFDAELTEDLVALLSGGTH